MAEKGNHILTHDQTMLPFIADSFCSKQSSILDRLSTSLKAMGCCCASPCIGELEVASGIEQLLGQRKEDIRNPLAIESHFSFEKSDFKKSKAITKRRIQ